MKLALHLCALLFLATGLVGQTSTPPQPKKAENGKAAAASRGAHSLLAAARPEGNESGAATAATSTNSSAKANAVESNSENATAPTAPPAPTLEDQVQQLRDLLESQSKELAATREQIKQQERKVQSLEEQLNAGNAKPAAAPTGAGNTTAASGTNASSSLVAASPSSIAGAPAGGGMAAVAPTAAQTSDQTSPANEVSPLQLKIGSAYIMPVGFMDFTGVWRSRNGGSGIGTNFAGLPYGPASNFQTNLSELRFSMQNSRIGFRVDANVKGSHVMGYMEADFLGNNPANVAVSSNSNTLRSRLYWVDLRKSAWEFLAGQSWSLATPNRVGVSPLPGDIFFSDNMDVNYQLGMVWGRIPEFRAVYHFPKDKAAFAIALDSPDQYMGGTNGSTAVTLPACCSYYAGGELDNGTTTLSPPNRAPDVIAKFVADPSKRLHFEVGGIARFFQLYNQTSLVHYSTTGGAGFVNLDVGLTKEFRLLTHNYWGDGGGRYIFGQVPDMAIKPNGSPSLVHAGSTVDGFEFAHKNFTFFGYYGAVYIKRDLLTDTNGCNIGWGFGPSASGLKGCTSPSSGQNRTIQEASTGFINNFWKDAKYGALSLIGQYSYLTRSPWYVAPGQPSNASGSMAFLDLRYTLPGSAPTLGKPGKE